MRIWKPVGTSDVSAPRSNHPPPVSRVPALSRVFRSTAKAGPDAITPTLNLHT
jgi:hypothetical protein